jgi:gluconolactonase
MPVRPRSAIARLVAALGLAGALVLPGTAAQAAPRPSPDCAGWHDAVLADGLGFAENALVEPSGSVLVTDNLGGRLLRVGPTGRVAVVATNLPGAGGLAYRGGDVAVTTGNSPITASLGRASGTIEVIDPVTAARRTLAAHLVAPNGLAILPDGSAVTTGSGGFDAAAGPVVRTTGDPAPSDRSWAGVTGTNGIATDPSGRWVYVSRSLAARAEVWRIPVDRPSAPQLVADLGIGPTTFLDDLTVTPDGAVWVAADLAGGVFRVDPTTGAGCHVAAGIFLATSVEAVAGTGGRPERLYVTTLTGALHVLTRASAG